MKPYNEIVALVKMMLGKMPSLRYRMNYHGIEVEDLIQEVCWRLLKYPPKGIQMSTAVTKNVIWSVTKMIRAGYKNHMVEYDMHPVSTFNVDTLDIMETLSCLPEKLKSIVIGRLEGKSSPQMARERGLTKQRISQLENEATTLMHEKYPQFILTKRGTHGN